MSAHQDKTVGWIRTFLARKRVATWMGAVWCASITHAVCSARLSGETMTSSGSHRLTAFCDPTARSARCRRWTGVKTQLARSIPVARWLAGRQKLLVERRDALLFPAPIAPACQAGGTSMRFRSWRVGSWTPTCVAAPCGCGGFRGGLAAAHEPHRLGFVGHEILARVDAPPRHLQHHQARVTRESPSLRMLSLRLYHRGRRMQHG